MFNRSMKPRRQLTTLGLLAILLLANSLTAQDGPAQEIVQANQTQRQTMALAMQKAARGAGVAILSDNLIIGSRNDVLIVSAPIDGVSRLADGELDRGAKLMFVFVSLPEGDGSAVPRGFYTVNLVRHRTQRGVWLAQLLDAKGVVVRELVATVATGDDPLPEGKIVVSINISKSHFSIDIHFKRKSIEVSFE